MTIGAIARYCSNCGQRAMPAWRHCPGCGQQLVGAEPEAAAALPIEKQGPAQESNRYSEAILSIRLGELERAGHLLTSLVQDLPHNFQALAMLGSVYLRLHRIEEAKQHLDRAVALAPESPFVRVKLAEYWIALGIPSRALEELARAEEYAAADIPLLIEIRTFSKHLREKIRGNLIREPPDLPAGNIVEVWRKVRHGVHG